MYNFESNNSIEPKIEERREAIDKIKKSLFKLKDKKEQIFQ